MLKLKQYLKPYIALLLGAVILLFGQAMLELTLPNYMSDIVNVGLQQGGITYASPEETPVNLGYQQLVCSDATTLKAADTGRQVLVLSVDSEKHTAEILL